MDVLVTVDRIEGDLAVLEVGGTLVDWPRVCLPAEVEEGSRLRLSLTIEATDTSDAEARLERLRARGPQDDIIDL